MKDGITIAHYKDTTIVRCCDYVRKDEIKSSNKTLNRTARQYKSLMGFTQEYAR